MDIMRQDAVARLDRHVFEELQPLQYQVTRERPPLYTLRGPVEAEEPEPNSRVQQIMHGVQNSISQATSGLLGRSGPVS